MKKLLALVLTVVLVASVFVGCGQTAEKETQKNGKPKYTIATDTVFKPFEYKDKNGDFVGIDVDIMAAVAEDQGFDYDLKSLGWDAAIAACQANQADAMIAGASITDERKNEGWIFSKGYYTATQCAVVKAGSKFKSLADLKGAKVAVKNGTQGEDYAKKLEKEYGFKITKFEDSPTMYQAVSGGQCDVCFEDTPIIKTEIKDGMKLEVVKDSENDGSEYGVAIFDKNKQEFLDLFNQGLENIKKNGKYDKIIEKYLGK